MIMLQTEFLDFNSEIKISSESSALIEKRERLKTDFKNKFPTNCQEKNIDISSSDIEFVLQGSFKLGTTIKTDGETDLDLGVIFPLDINTFTDCRELKKLGKQSLEIANTRIPEIKEPCVTVKYIKKGDDWLHLDFPMYAKYNGSLYLARGKTFGSYEWELADPKGLNKYICDKLTNSDGQLRRLVRYLKKWKQEAYSSNDTTDKKPPSIGLTLLVVDLYKENSLDLIAFRDICQSILNSFSLTHSRDGKVIQAEITKSLPVSPYTNVFKKFESIDNHGVTFYTKLSKAVNNLNSAISCDNEHDAATYVAKLFGSTFTIPEKDVKKYDDEVRGEHNFGEY